MSGLQAPLKGALSKLFLTEDHSNLFVPGPAKNYLTPVSLQSGFLGPGSIVWGLFFVAVVVVAAVVCLETES